MDAASSDVDVAAGGHAAAVGDHDDRAVVGHDPGAAAVLEQLRELGREVRIVGDQLAELELERRPRELVVGRRRDVLGGLARGLLVLNLRAQLAPQRLGALPRRLPEALDGRGAGTAGTARGTWSGSPPRRTS